MGSVTSPDRPAILCGDFNVVPAPIDSWNESMLNGHIFHTDDERARLRNVLDLGFHDLFRERFPDEQKFSWWDYRGGAFHRKMGLRIDFLLAMQNDDGGWVSAGDVRSVQASCELATR